MTEARPSPTSIPALAICALLFIGASAGAWAWFHVSPKSPEAVLEFFPRAALPGARFEAIPISEQAMETLANTNLLSGRFVMKDRKVFTVFFGDWKARSAREMNVVQHTPDVCWVGAGYTAVNLGQPAKVELRFGAERIPFECRAFRSPRGGHEELTIWCTLVSGQLFEEGGRFEAEQDVLRDKHTRQASANRRRGVEQFVNVVKNRIPGDASKQFVRFSTPVAGDPVRAVESLKQFGEEWLELRRTKPAALP